MSERLQLLENDFDLLSDLVIILGLTANAWLYGVAGLGAQINVAQRNVFRDLDDSAPI